MDVIGMPSKNVILSVNEDSYRRYEEICRDRGLLRSGQFRTMTKKGWRRSDGALI
jgi:hypothetical protein